MDLVSVSISVSLFYFQQIVRIDTFEVNRTEGMKSILMKTKIESNLLPTELAFFFFVAVFVSIFYAFANFLRCVKSSRFNLVRRMLSTVLNKFTVNLFSCVRSNVILF